MNHLMLWIYLFGVADDFKNAEFVGIDLICIFSVIAWIGVFVTFWIMKAGDERSPAADCLKIVKPIKKAVGWIALIFLILSNLISLAQALLPSSKTIAAMIIIPKIAANKDIQKLPANVAHTLNEAVIDWSKELAPKGGKK